MLLENDMTTSIVRWMKMKLNGYRPFTMTPNENDGRLSDTEMLLKSSTFVSDEIFPYDLVHSHDVYHHLDGSNRVELPEYRSSSPASLPPPPPTPPPAVSAASAESVKFAFSSGRGRLNLEELECDVSVEGCGPDPTINQKQEFSFTLYDLDGHGKITEDDIAGLVKTIYETLGQSIKVPHYGSKTIKVKLIVSPEKKSCKSGEVEEGTPLPGTKKPRQLFGCSSNKNKWSDDVRSSKNKERGIYGKGKKFRRRHSISSSGLSEDREADVSDDGDEEEVPLNNKTHNVGLINTPTTIFSKYKKRCTSLQRQELLQIIQANMGKNNLRFLTSRKPTTNGMLFRNRTKTQQQQQQQQPFMRQFVNTWDNPVPALEKCGNMFQHSFDSTSTTTKTKSNNDAKRVLHKRSHSFDLPNNRFAKSEENKKQPTSHELKHRYRAFEQARAEEQVVRWLEQEFYSPTKYRNNRKNNNNLNCKTTSKEDMKSKSCLCSNEKHEHHHFHKYVHHHYHHYHENPILV